MLLIGQVVTGDAIAALSVRSCGGMRAALILFRDVVTAWCIATGWFLPYSR
jgi:hypothetical protein